VHKGLDVDAFFLAVADAVAHRLELAQRELPRSNHSLDAQRRGEARPFRTGHSHLCARVHRQVRRDGAAESHGADVLHDERVHSGSGTGPDAALNVGQLVVPQQNVQGNKAFDTRRVELCHESWQLLQCEILRPGPRVDSIKAKVDGVSAAGDSRPELRPAAGGGQHLRLLPPRVRRLGGDAALGLRIQRRVLATLSRRRQRRRLRTRQPPRGEHGESGRHFQRGNRLPPSRGPCKGAAHHARMRWHSATCISCRTAGPGQCFHGREEAITVFLSVVEARQATS
jgi:hypothetical protein